MSRLVVCFALLACLGCGTAKTAVESTAETSAAGVTTPARSGSNDVAWPADLAEAVKQKHTSEAIRLTTRELEKTPGQAAWHRLRGSLYHQAGANDLAILDFTKAIELSPGEAALFNNRGFILLSLQQFSEARKDFDEAIRLNPEYAQSYNNRGLLLIAQGKYSEAVVQFNRALQIDSNYVDAYNNRGFARLQLKQLETALADFNSVLTLQPKYVNAFVNRGLLKAWAGDLSSAIADFTQAMLLEPRNPKFYQHRRDAYLRMGQVKPAIADEDMIRWLVTLADFDQKLARTPADAALYVARGRHLLQRRDEAAAARDAATALEHVPDFAAAHLLTAEIALSQQQYDQAISACTKVLEREANNAAYSLRADAWLALKKYDAALADYTACRRIDPAVAEAHLLRSRELHAAGQTAEADVELAEARSLDPGVEDRVR